MEALDDLLVLLFLDPMSGNMIQIAVAPNQHINPHLPPLHYRCIYIALQSLSRASRRLNGPPTPSRELGIKIRTNHAVFSVKNKVPSFFDPARPTARYNA